MLIKSINLRNARLMDFYQVMSLVIGFLKSEDLAALNLAQEAGDFKTVFEIFDKALKQAQKSGYTDSIIAADDNRDSIVARLQTRVSWFSVVVGQLTPSTPSLRNNSN